MKRAFNISAEEYIAVLETEAETLLRHYYDPNSEGTGHFNTTATTLQFRINELKKDISTRYEGEYVNR